MNGTNSSAKNYDMVVIGSGAAPAGINLACSSPFKGPPTDRKLSKTLGRSVRRGLLALAKAGYRNRPEPSQIERTVSRVRPLGPVEDARSDRRTALNRTLSKVLGRLAAAENSTAQSN